MCALLQPEFRCLGHVVGRDRVATDPEKVRAVKDWAVPVNLPELCAFLELVAVHTQLCRKFPAVKPADRKEGPLAVDVCRAAGI